MKNPESVDPEAFITRHSISSYKTYGEIVTSDNPMQAFNPDNQQTPDLTEKGVELATSEAESFFSRLNPESDILFFASSNEARALETANIYREVAQSHGFTIVKPEHSRSGLADAISGGDIRVVNHLSIYPFSGSNAVINNIFNPPAKRRPINWEKIDPEFRARFEKASAIIEADDHGSFGDNFAAHSQAVKEIMPEIQSAEELYQSQFKNIIRLAKFGLKKALEQKGKSVKILAFGHENYLVYALKELFEENGINNCETVQINLSESKLTGLFRGKASPIE